MSPSYEQLQLLQLLVVLVLGIAGAAILARRRRALVHAPMFITVIGYGIACVISNQLRYSTGDFTALKIISSAEYAEGTFWWCASEIIFIAIYLFVVCCGHPIRRGRSQRMFERKVFRKMRPIYIFSVLLLIAAFFLNPFRGRDYGVISATDASDLRTGGLLVSGLLLFILSAVTIPLLICRSIAGLGFALISIWLLLGTGSKAIAVVYLLVVSLQLWRVGGKLWTKRGRWRFNARNLLLVPAGVAIVAGVSAVLLTRSVSQRYGGEKIGIATAAAAATARFTQQEVACLIHAEDEWRQQFSKTYLVDTALSFVPGFVWPGKPKNPAYEINSLMNTGFTAASPSMFGALFLACDGRAYWLVLVLTAVLLGSADRILSVSKGIDFTDHVFWYLLYTDAMLFEGNFVIWAFQLSVLAFWVAGLHRYATTERITCSTRCGH